MKFSVFTLGKISPVKSMFTNMILRDLFLSLSREISRFFVFREREREKRNLDPSVKIFQDESRFTVILLSYFPGQFSSFHLLASVYLLPGRPSRILINRSTARSRFFVMVVRKNGVSSHILERFLRNGWFSFSDDALNLDNLLLSRCFFYGSKMEKRSVLNLI